MSNLSGPAKRALVVGICVGLAGLVTFAALAAAITPPSPSAEAISSHGSSVEQLDLSVARGFKHDSQTEPALLHIARFVTHLGGVPMMIAVNVIGVLTMLLLRQWRLALAWAIVSGTGGLGNVLVKDLFDRKRPGQSEARLADEAVVETNESFPSGHAMGATIGYGALGYALCVLLRRRGLRAALLAALAVLVLAICATRVYLRAHWLSDVIAGSGLGVLWLALCLTPFEILRQQRAGGAMA